MASSATGSASPLEAAKRTRTVTWEDPQITAREAPGRSGLEFLTAIAEGALPPPPIAQLLGMRLAEVSTGRAVFTLDGGEHLYNPIGSIHGGALSTLLDSAISCAVQTTLPAGTVYTTVELKVNFVRPVGAETGLLRCEASVIHSGRTISTGEGRLTGPDGKLYAHGTATCLVIGGRE